MNELGVCYEWGYGVGRDGSTALDWYRRAAEQGHAEAEHHLGRFYENGLGGLRRDRKEAKKWYHRASVHGYGKQSE